MPRTLVEAPPEVLQLVLEQAILPHLVNTQRELKKPLTLSVTQGVAPNRIVGTLATPTPPSGAPVLGQARISFRKNYGGDRFLFEAEVIFPRTLAPETGFSGFSMPGSVTVLDGGLKLEARSWTGQYNVWDFRS